VWYSVDTTNIFDHLEKDGTAKRDKILEIQGFP
jgi:hypothetical protein